MLCLFLLIAKWFTYTCMCAQSLQSCPTLCDPKGCSTPGSSVSGDSAGKNTGVDCHALLQGFFLTQGSKPGLLHCRQILYQLSHQGSPRILEWVAYPFSSRSSRPRNWTGVTCVAGRWFTSCVNQIPYDDTVEVTHTSKGLDLMPEGLGM